jgi:hypothetical protein
MELGRGEYRVNTMQRSGNYWVWPLKPDSIFYKQEDIIQKIDPPAIVGGRAVSSRGRFTFKNSLI